MKGYFYLTAAKKKLYAKEVHGLKRTWHKPWHQVLLEAIPYKLPLVINGEPFYAMWKLGGEE